LLKVPIFSPKD